MNAEDLVVDDCGYWEAIEALNELLPQLQSISSFALVVEPINSVDGAAFVIASQKEEIFWILDFIRKHETNDFEVLLATIDIVTQKQVI